MLYQKADNGKLSGRADGNVYMRNGRVRGMRVPALVRNVYTGAARGSLGNWSAQWNALTNLQRGSWLSATGNFRSDRFGNPVEIKGKELYVAFNANLLNIGAGPQPDYLPGVIAPAAFLTLGGVAAAGAGTFTITFTATPTVASTGVLVFATGQKSPGTYRPSQSAYRLITALPAIYASGGSIFTAYTTKWGALSAGSKIFLRTIVISDPSGKPSAAQDGVVTVAA